MGMTTYMYAPKDDAKHRAFWRDLYSVEEAGLWTLLFYSISRSNLHQIFKLCYYDQTMMDDVVFKMQLIRFLAEKCIKNYENTMCAKLVILFLK